MTATLRPFPANTQRFLDLLWRPGDVREVRIPRYNEFKQSASGYFDSPATLAAAVQSWDGKANIYVSLNPVLSDLLARANNRVNARAENTTSDGEVKERRWLFLDVDPARPSGISSTDAEQERAREVLDATCVWLRTQGWPEPIIAMSGNGYYALYRLALPNTPEATQLVEALLKMVAGQFNTDGAHIDTAVSNASRIIGLVGTLKVKGDATRERPHRRSHLVRVPEQVDWVTEAQLQGVVAVLTPSAAEPAQRPRVSIPLEAVLRSQGITFRAQPPDTNGVTWYHLLRCPFHDDGRPFEYGVGQKLSDGRYAGHCFHPEGQGRGWQEFKAALGLGSGASGGVPDAGEDIGLTRRLAEAITAEDYFAVDQGFRLYVFRGGCYRPDGERHVARRVQALCKEWLLSKLWSTHRVQEVAAYITTFAPQLWPESPTDRVNLSNGIFSLDPPRLEPHSPTFLSPVQLPVCYEPEARCPGWERQIQETLPSDCQQLVWEVLAWLLTSERSIQRALLFLGEGNNSKSRLLRATTTFLGEQNVVAVSLQKLEADRFAPARLVGKLANICPDLPSEHLTSTSFFKAITGHDRIPAEYKYKDSFEFMPHCKLLFSANRPPQSADASYAFFRRWVVVPFETDFEGRALPSHVIDARLADPRELSGALNRALAALPGLCQRGDFTESASMRGSWKEFRATTDPLAVWLGRATVSGPTAQVVKDTLLR